ncbi:MAG TPA: ABC transporter permease, partial [Rhodopila sp.]|nr:ABC transporter permease [Rhodopila sp.]
MVLILAGAWLARSGGIPACPEDAFRRLAPGTPISLDVTDLGPWDSGLIAFLWDVKRAAVAAGARIDATALPPSANKLI